MGHALKRGGTEIAATADESSGLAGEVERQVAAYFEGELREFDLPLDLAGSEFQRSVWQAIAAVPYGQTLTYGQIAAAVGRPSAYRAVGNACGANPVVIVVPCHRIVGTDRGLHGFGGGLDVKTWLLRHEGSLGTIQDRRALQAVLAEV
jgi:methylated-DNA-[protein]-cysteine S-methyltransferase